MAIKKVELKRTEYGLETVEPDPGLPRGYLSASAIDLYLMCPHAWELQYVHGYRPTTTPVSIIEGKAMHKAMEENNLHKIKTGDDLDEAKAVEVFNETFSDTMGEITDWQETPEDTIRSRGKAFTGQYLDQVAPGLRPLSAERKIEGTVGGVPILGFMDLEAEEGGKTEVLDYKVVKAAKGWGEVSDGLQAGLYSALTGTRRVGFISFVKNVKPKIDTKVGERSEASIKKVHNVVASVREGIQRGSFPLCNPTHWKCSEKFCGVWAWCRQGKGDK